MLLALLLAPRSIGGSAKKMTSWEGMWARGLPRGAAFDADRAGDARHCQPLANRRRRSPPIAAHLVPPGVPQSRRSRR